MEGSDKVGHIYNEDLGTELGKSVYDYEVEIIKGINALGGSVSYNELMSHLVDDQQVIGKPTFDKYLKNMVEERKLIRTQDMESSKAFYRIAPAFWKYILPSDEEVLRKWINQMNEFMPNIEKYFQTITLLDKIQVSGDFYQNLRRLCTWHEMILLRETIIRPDKTEIDELNAKFGRHLSFNVETFLSLRAELNGIISDLFSIIGKDTDGKVIYHVLQLHALLPERRLDISFVKEYNDYVALLEKHLKKEGPPLIFTDADGKPLDAKTTPSATYSLTLKKIPLENENKNNK